ncbi:hypothetical protein FVEG_07236 [Fusarium verticillioides 7600]|uniref:Uncharacterized protein n=1 Tax=Gibberella moniliformis (strain M3125 / FGSC 7600) TaxID=334819 RepID=W7MHH0_GIBM7|nr:hypothetical protein FVEG_07236 [Fusarium verticillioides 7600]EWG46975.1 hypothetical protein FVEG_07236 [Fusarium verticillioides 7600]
MLGAESTVETGWMSRPGTAKTMEGADGLDLYVHACHRDKHCHPLSVDSRCNNNNNGYGPGVYAMRSNNNSDALHIVTRCSNKD